TVTTGLMPIEALAGTFRELTCPSQPDITGIAPASCNGIAYPNIPVRLQQQGGGLIGYTTWSDTDGDFTLNGDTMYPLLNPTYQYRLAAIYKAGDTVFSSYK